MSWPSPTSERPPWPPAPPSIKATLFYWVFGVIAPILCLVFDPILFRSWSICGVGILQGLAMPVYSVIGVGIISFAGWLLFASKFQALAGLFAGVFATGSLVAFSIGLMLVPISLFGLLAFGLGALGFIPFITAWVYGRYAIRAWQYGWGEHPPPRFKRVVMTLSGLALVVSIFWASHGLVTPVYNQLVAAHNTAQEQLCTQSIQSSYDD